MIQIDANAVHSKYSNQMTQKQRLFLRNNMTKLQLVVEDIFYAKFIYFLEVEQEGHQPYLLLEMVQSQAFSEYSVE